MNKKNLVSNLYVGKYPMILNQHYIFIFNKQCSVQKYNARFKNKAITTVDLIDLSIIIEILNLKSINTPLIIIQDKNKRLYSNIEKKLIATLEKKEIKFLKVKTPNCDSFDKIININQNKFNSYNSTIEYCLPLLSNINTSTWSLIE